MILVLGVWAFVRALLGHSTAVSLENVVLRHQLAVLQRSVARPRLRRRDRIFWVGLSRLWAGWRSTLVIVQPATVLAWHRQGFRLYWRWKSRGRSMGRPPLDLELRTLIRRMARENPTWGRRRIQGELRFLGYELAELTVAKYMRRPSPRPSSTWRTFLDVHIGDIVAIDFFVVPTLTFRLLFGFLVLRHDRRELVHVNVTDHPTAAWAAHQLAQLPRTVEVGLVESFPEETAPKYLLRDRDAIYGDVFVRRLKGPGDERDRHRPSGALAEGSGFTLHLFRHLWRRLEDSVDDDHHSACPAGPEAAGRSAARRGGGRGRRPVRRGGGLRARSVWRW